MDLVGRDGQMRYYFGASYGSAQTALKRLEEPHVMLSYATSNNKPWELYNRHQKSLPALFIDNGAYSVFDNHGGYQSSIDEYLEYVAEASEKLDGNTELKFTLRDIPCSDEILETTGMTVEEHQELAVNWHETCLQKMHEKGVDAVPVCVLQGQTPDDYARHLRMHNARGTFTPSIGVGSLAGREIDEIREILLRVAEELGWDNRYHIHGFGLPPRAFVCEDIRSLVDSADSSKWSYGQYSDRVDSDERVFHLMAKKYVDSKRILKALFCYDTCEVLPEKKDDLDIDVCRQVLTEQIESGQFNLPEYDGVWGIAYDETDETPDETDDGDDARAEVPA